ncbi:MAG: N-acetyltransferase [Betaproteobacteria bacterium]|nr:N-acetyltransferase [Betaproteobacteria bacterium]
MSNSASRIKVRLIDAADQLAFLKQARLSHDLHRHWIDVPISLRAFRTYVEELSTENNRGYLIFRSDTQVLVGMIELRDIYYQNFRNSYVVYYGFSGHLQQGLMTEGLGQVIRIAFGKLRLHRLEANIQPSNVASIGLARACGFRKEAMA